MATPLQFSRRDAVTCYLTAAVGRYRYVAFTGVHATAAADVQGISEAPGAAGTPASLVIGYSYPIELGETVAVGAYVKPAADGTGRAVNGTASDNCGRAISGGVAGDLGVVTMQAAGGGGASVSGDRISGRKGLAALPLWRAAIARQRAGGARARLLCAGDSVTWGLYAAAPLQDTSYPGRLRAQMSSRYTVYEGPIWLNRPQGAVANDSRVSIGAGYNQVSYGPGKGTGLLNTTTTNQIVFGPVSATKFVIYYTRASNVYNFQWKIDSGSFNVVSANNGTTLGATVTTNSVAAGSHTLTIENVTGCEITAVHAIDDTTPGGVEVSRCGVPGSTTADWASDSDGRSSLPVLFDVYKPDLTVLFLTLNDYAQNVQPATSYANLSAIAARAQAAKSDIILVAPFIVSDSKTYQIDDYVTQIVNLGASLGVPVVSMRARWPAAFATGNAEPFAYYADTYHPAARGYADLADAVDSFV